MDSFYYDYENDGHFYYGQQAVADYDDIDDYAGDKDYNSIFATTNIETLRDIYSHCIIPSTMQTISFMVILFACNLSYSLLVLLGRKLWPYNQILPHLLSIVCGVIALQYTTTSKWLIVLAICFGTYILILIIVYMEYKRIGVGVGIFVICTQLILEKFLKAAINWHNLRGCQMIAAMKMISYAFDIEMENRQVASLMNLQNFLSYLGYIFCPKTCILGPWISHKMYLQMCSVLFKRKRWLLPVIINLTAAIVFVNLSNCLIPWWRILFTGWFYMTMYLEALAVRCSHYFASYSSQSIIAVGGLLAHYERNLQGYQVVKPMAIEMPRSLTHLVRNWNIPMHKWLKKYIFYNVKSACGGDYTLSLLCTYIVSALMHGFHFQVHLVLISLAGFTYVENLLRSKLALIYNACISTYCYKVRCPYTYCPRRHPRKSVNALLVQLANFSFSILTLINLSYIGVILHEIIDVDNNNNTEKYSQSTEKWYNLHFFGHWIHVIMYITYLCII